MKTTQNWSKGFSKNLFLAGMVLALGLVIVGCDDGGNNGTEQPPDPGHTHDWSYTSNTVYSGVWEVMTVAGPAGSERYGKAGEKGVKTSIRTCRIDGTVETVSVENIVGDPDGNDSAREKRIEPGYTIDAGGNPIEQGTGIEGEWSEWANYGSVTDWVAHPTDSTKEARLQMQERTHPTLGREERGIVVEERDKVIGPVVPTLPSTNPTKNVDTTGKIGNRFTSGIIAGTRSGSGNAWGVRVMEDESLLNELSQQAAALETFLAGSTGLPNGLKVEERIMKGSGSMKVGDYLTILKNGSSAVINTIFDGHPTERAAFDAAYAAYTQGHFIISRNWNTESTYGNNPEVEKTTAVGDLNTALGNAGLGNVDGTMGGRGENIPVSYADLLNRFTSLETTMKTQIISALGLGTVANADALASALVQQFQDIAELDAFVADLQKERLNTALDYEVSGFVASVGTQSDMRLASVNTQFSPEAVKKGAYGAEYTESGRRGRV
jgi:uncharacterized protein YidB (DUF937 family)